MRVLIMGCSARKNQEPTLLPAMERYDGPAFRTLRAYHRTRPQANLTVMVLSAHYGLVRGKANIPSYNQRMTADIAARLRPQVHRALAEQVYDIERCDGPVTDTLIMLGAAYRVALPTHDAWQAPLGTVTFTSGGIGRQLGQLKQWLSATEPPHAHRRARPARTRVPLRRMPAAQVAALLHQRWFVAWMYTRIWQ